MLVEIKKVTKYGCTRQELLSLTVEYRNYTERQAPRFLFRNHGICLVYSKTKTCVTTNIMDKKVSAILR